MADWRYLGGDTEGQRIGWGDLEFRLNPDGTFGPAAAAPPPLQVGADLGIPAATPIEAAPPTPIIPAEPESPLGPMPIDPEIDAVVQPDAISGADAAFEPPPEIDAVSGADPAAGQARVPDAQRAPESPPFRNRDDLMRDHRRVTENRKGAVANIHTSQSDELGELSGVLDETVKTLDDSAQARHDLWKAANDGLRARRKEIDGLNEAFGTAKIEPKPLIHGSTGQQIVKAIGLAMGVIGGAMIARDGGPLQNAALNILQKAVSDDIALQREEIERLGTSAKMKEGALRHYWDAFQDKDAAEASAVASQLRAQEVKLQAISKRYEGTRQGELAAIAMGDIEEKRMQLEMQADAAMKNEQLAKYNAETSRLKAMAAMAKKRGRGGGAGGGRRDVGEEARRNTIATRLGLDMSKRNDRQQAALILPLGNSDQWVMAGTTEGKKKLREAHNAAMGIARKTERIKQLVRKYGNEVTTDRFKTDAGATMETLLAGLVTDMKNSKGLGALDEGSIRLATDFFGDPTKWRANPTSIVAKLDEVMRITKDEWHDELRGIAIDGDFEGYWPTPSVSVGAKANVRGREDRWSQATNAADPVTRGKAINDLTAVWLNPSTIDPADAEVGMSRVESLKNSLAKAQKAYEGESETLVRAAWKMSMGRIRQAIADEEAGDEAQRKANVAEIDAIGEERPWHAGARTSERFDSKPSIKDKVDAYLKRTGGR